MNSNHKKYEPFLLTLTVFVVLLCLSLFDSGFHIGSFEFKPVHIFSDLEKKEILPPITKTKKVKVDIRRRLKEKMDSIKLKKIVNIDSIAIAEEKDLRITDYRTDTLPLLGRFFKALYKTEKDGSKTRIAYYGDSMIEGDLITQTLRNDLQILYGGKGVGFVPITSIVAGFRRTINHAFSGNWITNSFLLKNPRKSFGLSGFVFNPQCFPISSKDSLYQQNLSWVYYSASMASYWNLRDFNDVKLYYGRASNRCFIDYSINNVRQLKNLTGRNIVNEISLNESKPINNIKINFHTDSILDVYGLSYENAGGVYVDNYSVRGNSGLPLSSIPSNIMSEMNNYLKYDLVILQYGVNVASPEATDFTWYEQGMIQVVNHIKKNIPGADILIVSVGDRSHKENMEFVTQKSIPILVEAQRRVAQKTGVAFWNLYESMGGHNSMVGWVETKYPLANKDYTHVNFRGAEKIGSLINECIQNEYKLYKITKEISNP